MESILSKNFHVTGTTMEELLVALKKFRMHTQYWNMFDPSVTTVLHIKPIEDNTDFIELVDCKRMQQAIDGLSESKIPTVGLKKCDIPNELFERIACKDITTCMLYGDKIVFLDENSRSILATKCNMSGKGLYQKSLSSDMFLQSGVSAFLPTGKLSVEYPVAVIRKCENINVLISLMSEKHMPVDLLKLPELSDKKLSLSSWSITNYETMIEFNGPEVADYIPVIRVMWSDAGKGAFKRQLCVKLKGQKRSVVLRELKDSNIDRALNYFNAVVKKSEKPVGKPLTVLNQDARFRSIGIKRIRNSVEPLFTGTSNLTEIEFFHKVLQIPDVVGRINDTTDKNLELSLGELFSTGVLAG